MPVGLVVVSGSNSAVRTAGSMPGPLSATSKATLGPSRRADKRIQRGGRRGREGVDRVAHEVVQDGADLDAVHVDRGKPRLEVDGQRDARGLELVAQRVLGVGGEHLDLDALRGGPSRCGRTRGCAGRFRGCAHSPRRCARARSRDPRASRCPAAASPRRPAHRCRWRRAAATSRGRAWRPSPTPPRRASRRRAPAAARAAPRCGARARAACGGAPRRPRPASASSRRARA